MKTILVTGASGFVGGHVVAVLARAGYRIRCLVRKTSRLDFIKEWSPELVFGDVTSPADLEPAVEGVDGIVHAAGIVRTLTFADFMRINAEGSQNLYRACLAKNPSVRRIVHIGSLAALGPTLAGRPVNEGDERRPVSDYGRSKLAGHRIAEAHMDRLPIVLLMPPAVYGPFDKGFLSYFAWVKRGFYPMIGGEERRLSLIYVKDLARAVLLCLENDKAVGNEYIVEDGRPYAWAEIASAMGRPMGKSPSPLRLPVVAARAVGAVMGSIARLTGKPALISRDKLREILQPAWTCSSAKIRAELGFVPEYSLERGIEETYRWYMDHAWL
jgi:nucleoside-diphosphate-sugar epimerase